MPGPTSQRWRTPAAAAATAAALLLSGTASAGVFKDTAHARLGEAPPRDRDQVRGSCILCHGRPARARAGAFAGDDACTGCHQVTGRAGSYQGPVAYEQSAHGPRSLAVWPGPQPPARPARDAGRCVNCHAPHGAADASGLVPSLLTLRGEALCLGCHGAGSRLDVATARAKAQRHPAGGEPAAQGVAARGATCADCHNPHVAGEAGVAVAPEAPGALQGVARVRVANGAPGSSPVLSPVPASERTRTLEYEVCLRCHAGASALPAGSPDLGVLLNPANASYHPVEARGRNFRIDRRAFTAGRSWDGFVRCTDCHGGDGAEGEGLHGSSWDGLLRRRYLTTPGFQVVARGDLCFVCHAWEAYVEGAAGTRFAAHPSHAGAGVGCWSCHETHGSPDRPALVALRSPGMTSYQQTLTGGACATTCHLRNPPSMTYGVVYPR